jgi:hypothetical protein
MCECLDEVVHDMVWEENETMHGIAQEVFRPQIKKRGQARLPDPETP